MLHEGAGANVMAAFVEVVFDNSDGRLTVEMDEVVLRRTIGLKKDEFFLNRKRVTKSEVRSPYFKWLIAWNISESGHTGKMLILFCSKNG